MLRWHLSANVLSPSRPACVTHSDYQGAGQLRQNGVSIFVADLVGPSMLRELAPLTPAIVVAARSGSAYAAQIGTMAVTEEIDALRTIGIPPLELLVLP